MHPYLFELNLPFLAEPFRLRAFGAMVAIAFLVGAHILQRLAARHGDDPSGDPARFSAMTMWALFGIFGGARLMYVVVEILRDSETGRSYLADPLSMLFFWEGGLVMYGGMIGGVCAGMWRARLEGVRLWNGLDLGMTAAFFAQSIGRVGCLMVGDDYGAVVPEAYRNLPFPITVQVPDPLPPGSLFGAQNAGEVLWATQPWMSINALLLGIVAWSILQRRRYAGQVSLWVLLLYSITRFAIEHFRGDAVRGKWFTDTLSTSQLISIVAAMVCVVLLVRGRGRTDAAAA